MMSRIHIDIPIEDIKKFCNQWKVVEFALFGSVLNDSFRPDSDVDVLLSFSSDAHWSLMDLVKMQDELIEVFGRKVDIVEKAGLRNPFRRQSILKSNEVIYAA